MHQAWIAGGSKKVETARVVVLSLGGSETLASAMHAAPSATIVLSGDTIQAWILGYLGVAKVGD